MTKEISKFLSYVVRHAPETIGLKLDASGWADVAELVAKAKKSGNRIDLDTLRTVVAENDKQRFAFSDDGRRNIRPIARSALSKYFGRQSCGALPAVLILALAVSCLG